LSVRPDELRSGHCLELAAAAVENELDVRERLEPGAEARLRLAHPLGDRADAAVSLGVEVEDAIRFSEPDRPEHDSFRPVRASGHVPSSLGTASGRNALRHLCVVSGNAQDPDLYDTLVRLLRAREDAAPVPRAPVRGGLAGRRPGFPADGVRGDGRLDGAAD